MHRDGLPGLSQGQFAGLPVDCRNSVDPGIYEIPDLRNWSCTATTADQRRMENYVDRHNLAGKRILHIGVGSSGLARRFSARVADIVGTTIDREEIAKGNLLGLPNYTVRLQNKFTSDAHDGLGVFDFIFDNNLTSMCCCLTHLTHLLEYYSAKLGPGGQLVTDRVGLGWIPDLAECNPRWSFDFQDLECAANAVGLKAFRIDRNVYVLSRTEPARPPAMPPPAYWRRRVRSWLNRHKAAI